jgi:starch synthase
MPRLKVLFVSSECVPFAKTGGLADVVGALPRALAEHGHDVRVVLPRYRAAKRHPADKLDDTIGVPVGDGTAWASVWTAHMGTSAARAYLLEHDRLFDRDGLYDDAHGEFGDNLARFTFLSRGAIELCRFLDFRPDVIHVHDWQAALVPLYLDTLEARSPIADAATVLTLHNMGYQGWFDPAALWQTGLAWDDYARDLERAGRINLLRAGIRRATLVSTVSPRYAYEIQTPDGGEGLDGELRARGGDVIGILNGIDDRTWDPETDRHIPAHFSANDPSRKAECKAALQRELGLPERPHVPLIGVVSRFAQQKGIDIIAGTLERLLARDVQLAVLGSGEAWAEELFGRLSRTTDSVRAHLGMNEPLAHRIEAGSDLFLMPSRYEPCGLNQLYSQRYGTLPIVRAVGGLDDTVENGATGFKFDELSSDGLLGAIDWALGTYRNAPTQFRAMQIRAMRKPMGWAHASRQYEALYRLAMARRRAQRRA